MNIKKSVKIALINADKRQGWLANKVGMTDPALSTMLSTNRPHSSAIDKLAAAFDMKVSEFIALGE
jgi:hypothetical protein